MNEYNAPGSLPVPVTSRNQSRATIMANLSPCKIWIANDTGQLVFTDKDNAPHLAGVRRQTAAAWTAENPILSGGELGHESDTGLVKVGDGVTAWAGLGYLSGGSSSGTIADTFPCGNTAYTVVNAIVSGSSIVEVMPQTAKTGQWVVVAADGFFRIQSSVPESTDVPFYWQTRN